jgi:hypothetical protein
MSDEKVPTRHQSAGFPVLSLADAAEILRAAAKVGTSHSLGSLAGLMGHSTTNSGPFRRKLAALREWGVVDGRADRFTITPTGLSIALPRDPEDETQGLRTAFLNSAIFARTYRSVAKGRDVETAGIANNAVHNLGVAAAAKDDFVRSFVASAIASGFAERVGDRRVRFLSEPAAGEPVATNTIQARSLERPDVSGFERTRRGMEPDMQRPILRQVWATTAAQIVLEIRSARPLRTNDFSLLAKVVGDIEDLAMHMNSDPEPDDPRADQSG